VKIVNDYPPNIQTIRKFFDIKGQGVVFCWGSTLYVPNGGKIEKHLLAHEETHERQMKGWDPEEWWKNYLTDKKFRLAREVEAYRNQYKYIKVNLVKDRNKLSKVLDEMAEGLSGQVYGCMVSFKEAKKLIENRWF